MIMILKPDRLSGRMTLDQLIVLDAIVASGTFRGAADRLNKAQSAVSHQIKKLEDELGFDLFLRDSYRPRLSPEGEVFFRETTRVLEQVHGLKTVAAGLRSEQEPVISIAMTATMSLDPILNILEEVGQAFRGTHIKLVTEMMGGPLARLMEGEADLIIAGLHGVPIDEVEIGIARDAELHPGHRVGNGRQGLRAKSGSAFRRAALDRLGFSGQEVHHQGRPGVGRDSGTLDGRRIGDRRTRPAGYRGLSTAPYRDIRNETPGSPHGKGHVQDLGKSGVTRSLRCKSVSRVRSVYCNCSSGSIVCVSRFANTQAVKGRCLR